jgi:hypothetical protein
MTVIVFTDNDDTGGVHQATGTVSAAPAAVPEPTSLALFTGVIGWVAFSLKRRFGKKSAIH